MIGARSLRACSDRAVLLHKFSFGTNLTKRFLSHKSISGLVVEYIVAIDVTRVQFPVDAGMGEEQHWQSLQKSLLSLHSSYRLRSLHLQPSCSEDPPLNRKAWVRTPVPPSIP